MNANRTEFYTAIYAVQVIVLGYVVFFLTFFHSTVHVIVYSLAAIIALLIFRYYFYGKIAKGIKFAIKKQYTQAIVEFESFIENTALKPWLNRIYLLGWSRYTVSAKALAWNNIGACHYNLRQLEESRGALNTALSLDPHFPIPYINIAKIDRLENNEIQAQENFNRSVELGLAESLATKLIPRHYGVAVPGIRIIVFGEKLQNNKISTHFGLKPYIETIEKLPPEFERVLGKSPENSEQVLVMVNNDSTPERFIVALLVKCFNYERLTAHKKYREVRRFGFATITTGNAEYLQLVQSHMIAITASSDYTLVFEIRENYQ